MDWGTLAYISTQRTTIRRLSTNENSSGRSQKSTQGAPTTQWGKNPKKNHTKRVGRGVSLSPHHSIPSRRPALPSAKGERPARQTSSCCEEGRVSHQPPQPVWVLHEEPTSVSPIQRLAKLRCAEMPENKEQGQGISLPLSRT